MVEMEWTAAQNFLMWYVDRYRITAEQFLELLLIDFMSRTEVWNYFPSEMVEPCPFINFSEVWESGQSECPKMLLTTGRQLFEGLVAFYVSRVGEAESVDKDTPLNAVSDVPGWSEYCRRKKAEREREGLDNGKDS